MRKMKLYVKKHNSIIFDIESKRELKKLRKKLKDKVIKSFFKHNYFLFHYVKLHVRAGRMTAQTLFKKNRTNTYNYLYFFDTNNYFFYKKKLKKKFRFFKLYNSIYSKKFNIIELKKKNYFYYIKNLNFNKNKTIDILLKEKMKLKFTKKYKKFAVKKVKYLKHTNKRLKHKILLIKCLSLINDIKKKIPSLNSYTINNKLNNFNEILKLLSIVKCILFNTKSYEKQFLFKTYKKYKKYVIYLITLNTLCLYFCRKKKNIKKYKKKKKNIFKLFEKNFKLKKNIFLKRNVLYLFKDMENKKTSSQVNKFFKLLKKKILKKKFKLLKKKLLNRKKKFFLNRKLFKKKIKNKKKSLKKKILPKLNYSPIQQYKSRHAFFILKYLKLLFLMHCYYLYILKTYFLMMFRTYITLYIKHTALSQLHKSHFDILLKSKLGVFSTFTILNTIRLKLSLGYRMEQLIKNLSLTLDRAIRENKLFGYKLRFAGRYKKSSRSNLLYRQRGNLSSDSISNPLDYGFTVFKGRFGVTGIKIWLHHNSKFR